MIEVDKEKILKAALNSLPFTVKTHTVNHEFEMEMEKILTIFLSEFGESKIIPNISYCMMELMVNANKANTKRVFFLSKGLDINDQEDYKKGMETFKEETLNNIQYYEELQKKKGLYIKIVFHVHDNCFNLYIKNNVTISIREQMKIFDRIARSRVFSSMEDAMNCVDFSEGAGLGLIILVLMLKKLGLDEDAFDLYSENGETVAKLVIPFSERHKKNLNDLSEEIVKQINTLPKFPENISNLRRLIDDPKSEIIFIARYIAADLSLTADLLRIVNSAQYMLSKKVDNILEAVKMIGLNGIKYILCSYGAQKVLKTKDKEHWEHAKKVAFFAYNLAKVYIPKKEIFDDIYVGGILHDIGKILFAEAYPSLIRKIKIFSKERNIERNLLEDLTAGFNHAVIGAMIAERWNFPDPLIEAIKYHHEPECCDPKYSEIVYTIYFANFMVNFETEELKFDQLSSQVLKVFKISTEEQFSFIRDKLSAAYDIEKKRNTV